MTRRCAGGQEQQPLWRRRHLVVRSTIRILSRTTIRTPGCKRNAQTPAPFRRRGKGHICEKSAFVGISRARILLVCCVLCSLVGFLCERVGVCAGKNSFERDYENCVPRGVRTYALMSLCVLLKIWLCKCLFLTLMRLVFVCLVCQINFFRRGARDTIFGRDG